MFWIQRYPKQMDKYNKSLYLNVPITLEATVGTYIIFYGVSNESTPMKSYIPNNIPYYI